MDIFFTFAPMKSPIFERLSPFAFLVAIVVVTLISFLIFTFLGIFLAVSIYDIELGDLLSSINPDSQSNIRVLKFLQIFQSIGIFIVPAFITAWLTSRNTYSFLGFRKEFQWYGFALMVLALVAAEPVVAWTGIVNEKLSLPDFLGGIESWMTSMEAKAMELTEAFLTVTNLGGLSVNLLMIAIIPGIGEELFFRGLLQPLFQKWFRNTFWAVVFTSVLFSALHMQFYGFLPRFLLGVLFGYFYVWTKNIWFPILAHTIHNAIPVVGYYLYSSDKTSTSFDEVASGGNTWIWAIAGFILLIIFTKLLRERFQYQNNIIK